MDYGPQLQLSSRGERRATAAWPQASPSPSATAATPAKPPGAEELRAGRSPVEPSQSDAAFAKPIRERGRYTHCGLADSTRVEVHATIYDGSAVSVNVVTSPENAALNVCVGKTVRDISWARELIVRNVDVSF
jgi:hypothetical protein